MGKVQENAMNDDEQPDLSEKPFEPVAVEDCAAMDAAASSMLLFAMIVLVLATAWRLFG